MQRSHYLNHNNFDGYHTCKRQEDAEEQKMNQTQTGANPLREFNGDA